MDTREKIAQYIDEPDSSFGKAITFLLPSRCIYKVYMTITNTSRYATASIQNLFSEMLKRIKPHTIPPYEALLPSIYKFRQGRTGFIIIMAHPCARRENGGENHTNDNIETQRMKYEGHNTAL